MHTLDYLQLHLFMVEGGVDINRSDDGQFRGIPTLLGNGDSTNATLDAQHNDFDSVRVDQSVGVEADARHEGVFFRVGGNVVDPSDDGLLIHRVALAEGVECDGNELSSAIKHHPFHNTQLV